MFLQMRSLRWQMGVVHQVSRARGEEKTYNVNFIDWGRRLKVAIKPNNLRRHQCPPLVVVLRGARAVGECETRRGLKH